MASPRRAPWIATLLAAASIPGGCGGDSDDDTGGGGKPARPTEATTLRLTSPGGGITYDKRHLSAPAGKVTIVYTNDSDRPHNVIVIPGRKLDYKKKAVLSMDSIARYLGKTRIRASANLKPGDYTYYCSVYNHAALGMKGRLIVH